MVCFSNADWLRKAKLGWKVAWTPGVFLVTKKCQRGTGAVAFCQPFASASDAVAVWRASTRRDRAGVDPLAYEPRELFARHRRRRPVAAGFPSPADEFVVRDVIVNLVEGAR